MFERTRQGAVDIIGGDLPLNRDSVAKVGELLEPCLMRAQPRLVFSLERVPHIDSAGLELLLDAEDTCTVHGGMFKLAMPNSLCREILDVTGVSRRIEIFPDMTTAVGSFAR